MTRLFNLIEQGLVNEAPSADEFDWPEPDEGDEDDDPMYDSTRSYLDQIDRYKEHQGRDDEATALRTEYTLTCEVCGEEFNSIRPTTTACSDKCRQTRFHLKNPDYQSTTWRKNRSRDERQQV